MKRILSLIALAAMVSMSWAQTTAEENARIAANKAAGRYGIEFTVTPMHDEGETSCATILFHYTFPDGNMKQMNIELPWPVEFFTGGEVKEVDINFDGIDDVQVELGLLTGSGTNSFYAGLLWDKEKQEFVEIPVYCDIVNAEPDPGNKCIMGYIIETPHVSVQKWEWKDGILVKTHEHEENLLEEE